MAYYSQFEEDSWIAKTLKPKPGIFCEVGAYDGIASSNTLYFEQHGWYGMCVEPDPELAWKCFNNRVAKTWCCAAGKNGAGTLYLNMQDRGTSSLDRDGKPMPVVIESLDNILQWSGYQHVNLLSIDTEGTELEVWKSLTICRPEIVILEFWTQPNPPRDQEILKAMEADHYRAVHRTEANLIFVPA